MVISDKTHSIDEFDAFTDAHPEMRLELIDGRIVEKVTSEKHGKIAGWLVHCLIVYLQEHPEVEGHWSVEASYKTAGDDKNVRPSLVARRCRTLRYR